MTRGYLLCCMMQSALHPACCIDARKCRHPAVMYMCELPVCQLVILLLRYRCEHQQPVYKVNVKAVSASPSCIPSASCLTQARSLPHASLARAVHE